MNWIELNISDNTQQDAGDASKLMLTKILTSVIPGSMVWPHWSCYCFYPFLQAKSDPRPPCVFRCALPVSVLDLNVTRTNMKRQPKNSSHSIHSSWCSAKSCSKVRVFFVCRNEKNPVVRIVLLHFTGTAGVIWLIFLYPCVLFLKLLKSLIFQKESARVFCSFYWGYSLGMTKEEAQVIWRRGLQFQWWTPLTFKVID